MPSILAVLSILCHVSVKLEEAVQIPILSTLNSKCACGSLSTLHEVIILCFMLFSSVSDFGKLGRCALNSLCFILHLNREWRFFRLLTRHDRQFKTYFRVFTTKGSSILPSSFYYTPALQLICLQYYQTFISRAFLLYECFSVDFPVKIISLKSSFDCDSRIKDTRPTQ